ncbi:MAG: hypothetical protein AB7S78_10670 [Candidatus Omnitrophota bacterium]
MSHLRKNKFLLTFLFFAVLGLAALTAGGEYLHDHIHDHHDQDSRQECPVYQIQTQAFTASVIFSTVLFLKAVCLCVIRHDQVFVFQPSYFLPDSQAPPRVV